MIQWTIFSRTGALCSVKICYSCYIELANGCYYAALQFILLYFIHKEHENTSAWLLLYFPVKLRVHYELRLSISKYISGFDRVTRSYQRLVAISMFVLLRYIWMNLIDNCLYYEDSWNKFNVSWWNKYKCLLTKCLMSHYSDVIDIRIFGAVVENSMTREWLTTSCANFWM